MGRVVESLCCDCNRDEVLRAVDSESFKGKKRTFSESGDNANAQFMQKGTLGDHKRFLSRKLVKEIRVTHIVVMQTFGYSSSYKLAKNVPKEQENETPYWLWQEVSAGLHAR